MTEGGMNEAKYDIKEYNKAYLYHINNFLKENIEDDKEEILGK